MILYDTHDDNRHYMITRETHIKSSVTSQITSGVAFNRTERPTKKTPNTSRRYTLFSLKYLISYTNLLDRWSVYRYTTTIRATIVSHCASTTLDNLLLLFSSHFHNYNHRSRTTPDHQCHLWKSNPHRGLFHTREQIETLDP